MRTTLFISVLFAFILIPLAARALDQETVDRMIFLLRQPEWNLWGDGVYDDATLYEGLEQIHDQALADGDDILLRQVIWAMGETEMAAFAPTIIESMEQEPTIACFALGKMSSEDGVYALIEMLDNDDMQVRDAAAWGLGNVPYDTALEDAKNDALYALNVQMLSEEEDWVREDILAAVAMIETGIAMNEAFAESAEPE